MPLSSATLGALQKLQMLAGALVTTTFGLFAVNLLMPPGAPEPQAAMLPMLALSGVGTAVASVIVPALQGKRLLATMRFEVSSAPPGEAATYRDPGQPGPSYFVFPDQVARQLLRLHQTRTILGMALAEAVAADGLVLGRMGFPWFYAVPFFCVCWALQALHFPTLARVVAPAEKKFGATFRAD